MAQIFIKSIVRKLDKQLITYIPHFLNKTAYNYVCFKIWLKSPKTIFVILSLNWTNILFKDFQQRRNKKQLKYPPTHLIHFASQFYIPNNALSLAGPDAKLYVFDLKWKSEIEKEKGDGNASSQKWIMFQSEMKQKFKINNFGLASISDKEASSLVVTEYFIIKCCQSSLQAGLKLTCPANLYPRNNVQKDWAWW